MKLDNRFQQIELILTDVDGVLTDGSIIYDNNGTETKNFNVRDGLGIQLWQRAGYRFGLLTARTSHIVKVRAAELNIEIVRQGFEDKLPAAKELIAEAELTKEQVCYIGDDLTDTPVMRYVGLGIAVRDAAEDVRGLADLITKTEGGRGAVREVIETALKSKKRWGDLIKKYVTS